MGRKKNVVIENKMSVEGAEPRWVSVTMSGEEEVPYQCFIQVPQISSALFLAINQKDSRMSSYRIYSVKFMCMCDLLG